MLRDNMGRRSRQLGARFGKLLLLGQLVSGAVMAQDAETPSSSAAAKGEASESAKNESGAQSGEENEETETSIEKYDEALLAYKNANYRKAAPLFFEYISGNDSGVDQYERAEFYFAKCLRKLGIHHAASEYFFVVAKEQKNPSLLPLALSEIEHTIEQLPHDDMLLIQDLIGSSEFGTVRPELRAFVEYHKGMMDLRARHNSWAARHFAYLDAQGNDEEREPTEQLKRYIVRAKMAKMLTTISQTHNPPSLAKKKLRLAARADLEKLIEDKEVSLKQKNDAKKVIARLYFEEGRYKRALEWYEGIEAPFLSVEEADLFLEKAWTLYYAGDLRRTLGILLSLDAPSYRRHFQPERFVLKALAYQGLCHYAAAKGAAREFMRRYGSSLQELRRTRIPTTDPVVRRAAVQRKRSKNLLSYLATLRRERAEVDDIFAGPKLINHLTRLYDLKIRQTVHKLDAVVKEEADRVANTLLESEAQVRLVDYEISLEVFRRLKKSGEKDLPPPLEKLIPIGGSTVYYDFEGEYWNDELHNYRFRIENRCVGEGLFK